MEIPIQELNEGIELCLKKSQQLVADALLIANKGGNLVHAAGLYLFALEEFGIKLCCSKNQRLMEIYALSQTGSLVEIDVFGMHMIGKSRKHYRNFLMLAVRSDAAS